MKKQSGKYNNQKKKINMEVWGVLLVDVETILAYVEFDRIYNHFQAIQQNRTWRKKI